MTSRRELARDKSSLHKSKKGKMPLPKNDYAYTEKTPLKELFPMKKPSETRAAEHSASCKYCGIKVRIEHLENHINHFHRPDLTLCQYCNTMVRKDRVQVHMQRVHMVAPYHKKSKNGMSTPKRSRFLRNLRSNRSGASLNIIHEKNERVDSMCGWIPKESRIHDGY